MVVQSVALCFFTAVMAVAAVEDFRRLTIPNLLPLLLCVSWPLYAVAVPGSGGMLGAAGCALAVFLGGAVLFARGWLGGGDVKLLAAATLWAGPAATPALLVYTGVLGGVMALCLLMPFAAELAATARLMLGRVAAGPENGPAVPVPYGIAIAGAALIVVLSPLFG
jgi:prepilin peptidase CpaA